MRHDQSFLGLFPVAVLVFFPENQPLCRRAGMLVHPKMPLGRYPVRPVFWRSFSAGIPGPGNASETRCKRPAGPDLVVLPPGL